METRKTKRRKEWVLEAVLRGKSAFKKGYCSAPHANSEFMEWIPNKDINERKSFLLRKAIYIAYAKGWNIENLNQLSH